MGWKGRERGLGRLGRAASDALEPVCDLWVGPGLPICKVELASPDARWQEDQEVWNEQVPAPGAVPTPGHRQAKSGRCL